MPFIIAFLLLVAPRLLAVFLYLFSDWFATAFVGWFWPFIGFLFLPYTLLWYSVVNNMFNHHWSVSNFIILVIVLMIDLGYFGFKTHSYRNRR